jgi:hypothetical protein
MSKRKMKRTMVRELGIEKFSDIVKRKLKSKNADANNRTPDENQGLE